VIHPSKPELRRICNTWKNEPTGVPGAMILQLIKTPFLCFIIGMLSLACSGETGGQGTPDVPYRNLSIVDSIGSEFGAISPVLGKVSGVLHHPRGGVLVLDGISNVLMYIEPDGEVSLYATSGSGPGHLLNATEMALAGNEILVLDKAKRRILKYSLAGEYLDNDISLGLLELNGLIGRQDGCILALQLSFEQDQNGQIDLLSTIGTFNESLEVSGIIDQKRWEPPYNEIYSTISQLRFCAGESGPIYYSPDASNYFVEVIDITGEQIGLIARSDVERIALTDEEIDEVSRLQEEQLRGQFIFQGVNPPNPFERIILLVLTHLAGSGWL